MNPPYIISTPAKPELRHLRAWMRRYKAPYLFRVILLIALCLVPGVASAAIVATLPPLAGLVRMLDPEASVNCLLPPGADPHHFQLTPRQVQKLRQASLLLRSSYDDGHWSGIRASGASFDMWPHQGHGWTSPEKVRARLPALAAELEKLAPQRSAAITAALHKAQAACDTIDAAWKKALAPYHKSGVIMQHNAWQAMLQHYGVPVWVVLEAGEHGDEIGPHTLQTALNQIHAHPGILLWGNREHSERALQWLRDQQPDSSKPHLLIFDPIGDCGMTWTQLMQLNLKILKGLSGR